MGEGWRSDREGAPVLFGLADPLPTRGKTFGYVRIPHATDASPFGFSAVPLVVVANGDGATALLMAGSNGDEHEGQVALSRLCRELTPEAIVGRVIILPAAGAAASRVGRRHSPIDGLNLNRSYPGDPFGPPTSATAYFIEQRLMAEADIVVDLHGGGSALSTLPSAGFVDHADQDERGRRFALALAFGAPSLLVARGYQERNSSGAARRAGAVRIGTELGGGGGLEPDLVDLATDGLTNVLRWGGILRDAPYRAPAEPPAIYEIVPERDYVHCLDDGLFEPAAKLGSRIVPGDTAGLIHDVLRPWRRPAEAVFEVGGTVVARRLPSLTRHGDCLYQLAADYAQRFPRELSQARKSRWLQSIYGSRRPRVRRTPA